MENCYTKMSDGDLFDSLEKLKAYRDDPNNSMIRDIFSNHIVEVETELRNRDLLPVE